MDANGPPGGGGFGLVHGAFDAVGHEVYSRVGSRPSGGDVVGKYECWSPSVVSAPALGDFEGTSAGEHGTKSGRETAEVLGARLGHLDRHGVRAARQAPQRSRVRTRSMRCDHVKTPVTLKSRMA